MNWCHSRHQSSQCVLWKLLIQWMLVISLLEMYGLYLWKCYHYCTISYNPIYSHPSKILASYSQTRLEFTYQFEEGYLFGIPQLVWHCHNGYESNPIASLVRH